MNTKILVLSLISGLSTVVGCLIMFVNKRYRNNVLSFSFGLSFSVMLLVSIFELIPESISYGIKMFSIPILFILSLILLMAGGGVVYYLDKLSTNDNELYNVGWLCMLSVLIHNIPEGIITAITLMTDFNFGLKMFLIILVHNIPEGISISLPIYYSGHSKCKALLYSIVSGGGEVLGALVGILICKLFNLELMLYILLIVVAGIMIYLSCRKLFIEGLKCNNDNLFICGILLGVIIVVLTI